MSEIRQNWLRFGANHPREQTFTLPEIEDVSTADCDGKPIECIIHGDLVSLRSVARGNASKGRSDEVVGTFKILPNGWASEWIRDPVD